MTKRIPIASFAAALLLVMNAGSSDAREASPGMKEFNKTCPAPKLCESMDTSMEACGKGNRESCQAFVEHYRKLLPEYDCQRPFDSTPTVKYVVPAIWLCGSHERYLGFLSKMKAKSAQQLFGSRELRDVLDGDLAEQYTGESLAVGRRLNLLPSQGE